MGKRGRRAVRNAEVSVFGAVPKLMSETQLPLTRDVGLHVAELELGGLGRGEAIAETARKIEHIYKTGASINTIALTSIQRKIKTLLQQKRALKKGQSVDVRTGKSNQGKFRKKKGNSKRAKERLEDKLDDIFLVKSSDPVPQLEEDFYQDQCNQRQMHIGGVDRWESKARKQNVVNALKKQKRSQGQEALLELRKRKSETEKQKLFSKQSWNQTDETDEEEIQESEVGRGQAEVRVYGLGKVLETATVEKRRRLSQESKTLAGELMETCERFGISETATSTLFNLFTAKSKEDQKLNQSQVAKMKRKIRLKKVEEFEPENIPEAIGFDERKDDTKVVVGEGHNGRKKFETKKEEHCVVILFPGDEFAGHVVPQDGSGATLAKQLARFVEDRQISMTRVKSLVSDGCEKMVGWKSGVHATLESIFKVPFQRIICFFHHLEKTFEVILLLYSGHTTSPGTYSRGVGKEVKGEVHKLTVVAFGVLPNPALLSLIDNIPEDVFKDLSTDHQIFIRLE